MIILLIFNLFASCSTEHKKDEKEFFVFEPDIRLFTSYAFMNAGGFDLEWNDTMHPFKLEIRNYLDSILSDEYKIKIREYNQKVGGISFSEGGVYTLNLNYPPDLKLEYDSDENSILNILENYDSLLQEFYFRADIPMLWDKYKEKLHQINLQYKPYAEKAIKQITDYCRVDSNFYRNIVEGNFYYQQIPLMSYFTAFIHETGNDLWVIGEPTERQSGPSAFYHESLHRIVDPIIESNSNINIKIEPLVKLSQEKLKGSYNSITLILCESFVRTIDRILLSKYYNMTNEELSKIIEDEYKLGHILTFYLMGNLSNYETSDKTLEKYYPELIANIDLEYEKLRWINYWENGSEK